MNRLISYVRALARRRRIDAELEDELRFHLEREAERNMQRGMPPAEARRIARAEFGGVVQTREAVRDVRSIWLEPVWRDVRLSFRLLGKHPIFTATVSLTLAICLGANAVLFAIVDHVLLRPLSVPEPDRVVITGNRYPRAGVESGYSTSAADYVDRLRETDVFDEQALFKVTNRAVDENGTPARKPIMGVTPSFFRLARVEPILGRIFTDDEARAGRGEKVLLSYGLWQSQFGGDPSVVGHALRIDGRAHTIVGVMPRTFTLIAPEVLAWTPLVLSSDEQTVHYNDVWGYIARLKPRASIDRARSEIAAINRANLDRFPQFKRVISDTGFHTVVEPLHESLVKDVRSTLYLLWGGALFVLLIGLLNVSNLVMARARARGKELATRLALGAGRGRIARQLITEGLVLALTSAVAGLLLGRLALRQLSFLNLQDLPRGGDIEFDASTVMFTLAAAAIVGIVLGALPAIVSMPATPATSLSDQQRATTAGSSPRLRRMMVAAQVAFAFVLLVGAGLLLDSFRRVLAVDPGFDSSHVFTASVSLPPSRYADFPAARQFISSALAQLRALPSVTAAGVTDTIPFGANHTSSLILPEGYQPNAGESIVAPTRVVASSGYFQTMCARLLAGRYFDERDVDAAPNVAIVDQALAARFWPGASAIGRRLYRPDDPSDLLKITPTTQTFTVVGVIAPMKLESLLDSRGAGAYYFPIAQQPERMLTFAIRTGGDVSSMPHEVRAAIQSVDPELPVFDLQPMDRWTLKSLASRRAAMALSVIFSGVGLFLAAVGIYGVLAYLVTQRRKEIGIRLALGATGSMVFSLVLREGVVISIVGLGVGVAGVASLRSALSSELFGITMWDPIVLAGVSGLLALVAIAACAVPAWRATRIDPRTALSS
jgi:predicted permease